MSASKFALIGDVHAEDESLYAVLEWLKTQTFDAILCVGDVVDGAGDGARCIELLRENSVLTVCGNHDSWFLSEYGRDAINATAPNEVPLNEREWLESLPLAREFATVLGPLLLCHGVGLSYMQRLRPDDEGYALESNEPLQKLLSENHFRLMVGGHTHLRMVRSFGALTVVNAGALRRGHDPCFAILDCEQRMVQFFDVNQTSIVAGELVGF